MEEEEEEVVNSTYSKHTSTSTFLQLQHQISNLKSCMCSNPGFFIFVFIFFFGPFFLIAMEKMVVGISTNRDRACCWPQGRASRLLVALKGKIEQAVETVEHVTEVVEEIAEEAEKIVEEVEAKLPGDSKLKEALDSFDHLAKVAINEAKKAEDIIHKVVMARW